MPSSPPIVILAPRMTADSQVIWRTCLELGWSAERLQGWRVPDHLLSKGRPIVIYGEPLFAEAVGDQLGLTLFEPPIDWLTAIPREYLHRDIELTTLGDARTRPAQAFVKPADGKIFEPKVYSSGSALPTDDHVDLDVPVLLSGVVNFRLEVRCFVRDRKVVTRSPYWREDELAERNGNWPFEKNEAADAATFADTVLADRRVELPPSCTLDIGCLSDGRWAIVEANPCWGAGLYGCDPKEVLYSLREAIRPRDAVTPEQKKWISKRQTVGKQ